VTAHDFATSVDRLLHRVRHWEQSRWWSPVSAGAARPQAAGSAAQTRAELVYALLQRLADLDAEAEGRRHRVVPHHGDLVLADQLRVLSDDLLAAGAPDETLTLARDEVDAVRRAL
jgi:hypothetical protein